MERSLKENDEVKKTKNAKQCLLADLKLNECGKVLAVRGENELIKRRLYDMGITRGVFASVKKIAPLGDPVSLEIRGYELVLRKSELKNVLVEKIK